MHIITVASFEAYTFNMQSFTVIPILNSALPTVDISATLGDAHALMVSKNVRHLIVKKEGGAVGVISDHDLMRAFNMNIHAFYALKSGEKASENSAKIADLMGRPVQTLDAGAPLTAMVDLMLNGKISCVLLTTNSAVSGMMTHDDLLKILKKIVVEQERHKEAHPSSLQIILSKLYTSPVGTLFDALSNTGI